MAVYLGIDVRREGYLLPLARMALLAPLPRGWDIYKDDAGEPFYYHRATQRTSYRHPADEYFMAKVLEDRSRHLRAVQDGGAARASEPWLELNDACGKPYWYNFRSGERSDVEPPALVAIPDTAPAGPGRRPPPAAAQAHDESLPSLSSAASAAAEAAAWRRDAPAKTPSQQTQPGSVRAPPPPPASSVPPPPPAIPPHGGGGGAATVGTAASRLRALTTATAVVPTLAAMATSAVGGGSDGAAVGARRRLEASLASA